MLQHGYSPSDETCKHFLGKLRERAYDKRLSPPTMLIVQEMHLRLARSVAVCLGTLLPSAAAFCNAQP